MGIRKSDTFAAERARISAILKEPPGDDYDSVAAWQKELQAAVQELARKQIEPVFNQRLASMPQATVEEKQAMCRWANGELRFMGLGIRCPKTGEQAMLRADYSERPGVGRFRIELVGREHGHKCTKSFASLIPLELVNAFPKREPLAEYWAEKLSHEKPGGKKSR